MINWEGVWEIAKSMTVALVVGYFVFYVFLIALALHVTLWKWALEVLIPAKTFVF